MTNWVTTVHFRDLLDQFDDNADELEEIARVKPLWVERFNGIPSLKHFAKRFGKIRTIAELDKVLHQVYDFCDAERIWVEL